MKIRWLGHAAFLLESGGTTIITDPFKKHVGYPVFTGSVDIVTVSHDHNDHNAVGLLKGYSTVLHEAGDYEVSGISIKGFESFHDKQQGRQRGKNIIFLISAEGMNLVHLGDLGHELEPEQVEAIGRVDLLLLPVGGYYTIDAEDAFKVAGLLNPGIIIPMHYQTQHCNIKELAPVEGFIAKFDQVVKLPFLELKADELSDKSGVILLEYPTQ